LLLRWVSSLRVCRLALWGRRVPCRCWLGRGVWRWLSIGGVACVRRVWGRCSISGLRVSLRCWGSWVRLSTRGHSINRWLLLRWHVTVVLLHILRHDLSHLSIEHIGLGHRLSHSYWSRVSRHHVWIRRHRNLVNHVLSNLSSHPSSALISEEFHFQPIRHFSTFLIVAYVT
jgi:hypothetical protein